MTKTHTYNSINDMRLQNTFCIQVDGCGLTGERVGCCPTDPSRYEEINDLLIDYHAQRIPNALETN